MKLEPKPAYGVGDAVIDRRNIRTGKIVSVRLARDKKADRRPIYFYTLKYGLSLWEANEDDLTLQSRAPQTRTVDGPAEHIAAKELQFAQRENHLVGVLSGQIAGCMACSHLERTTKGAKTLCISHRSLRPKGRL